MVIDTALAWLPKLPLNGSNPQNRPENTNRVSFAKGESIPQGTGVFMKVEQVFDESPKALGSELGAWRFGQDQYFFSTLV